MGVPHRCALVAEDVDCTAHVELSTRTEDGLMFFKVQKVRVNFTIGHLRLHFDNLFNGQKSLGKGAVAAREHAMCNTHKNCIV